jgi:phenylalanyl-tRNA synthetase beta chain
MNISKNWLAQYVDIDCGLNTLCEKLTMAGIEVEAIETTSRIPAGVVAAKILERAPHPGADKLSVCRVFDGKNELQIVCGAPNCDAGKLVPLATVGTVFKSADGDFTIKKAKLRGVESSGMMCSAAELGLDGGHGGLLELPADTPPGTPLEALYPGDSRIEIEVTPNRPDWLSHWGVARDVSCLLGTAAKLPELKLPAASFAAPADLVTVADQACCPRYTGRIIRNVKVAESPAWLKERLLAVGLRPINNIVDITNFILMELGQPLHAFDLDLLAGRRVVARRAKAGEVLRTLDGRELKLADRHLVIADAEKPMALAGVMGGESSGVTEKTVNVLLESAVFNATAIRATGRELGISSDSSYRFERGVDFDMADFAGDRAAQLIVELAGGELSEKVDVHAGEPALRHIHCRFDRVRALIGSGVSNERIVEILARLRLEVREVSPGSCEVIVPRFRLDLEREADLIEEVARIDGLDRIPVLPVTGKVVSSIRRDAYVGGQTMRDELIGFGLFECMNYSMVSEKSALADRRFGRHDLLMLDNPLSAELAAMRPSLFGEMLESVERNISRRNLHLQLFELGRVFCGNPERYPEERFECCIMLTGLKHPERYSAELGATFDFYDLKGLLESWMIKRRLADASFAAVEDGRFASGEAAALLVDGEVAGGFGRVADEYTAGWRTTYPVYAAVIEVEKLLKAKRRPEQYQALSQFPATSRDVAFIAPAGLENAAVVDFIRRAGLKQLESVELFDIFADEKTLGAGRKSMAYKLVFRHAERTLTDVEVNKAFERLRTKLAEELKVELR